MADTDKYRLFKKHEVTVTVRGHDSFIKVLQSGLPDGCIVGLSTSTEPCSKHREHRDISHLHHHNHMQPFSMYFEHTHMRADSENIILLLLSSFSLWDIVAVSLGIY